MSAIEAWLPRCKAPRALSEEAWNQRRKKNRASRCQLPQPPQTGLHNLFSVLGVPLLTWPRHCAKCKHLEFCKAAVSCLVWCDRSTPMTLCLGSDDVLFLFCSCVHTRDAADLRWFLQVSGGTCQPQIRLPSPPVASIY